MTETLFDKIIKKDIPADVIYEDEKSIVIKDINPQAPIHLTNHSKKKYTQCSQVQMRKIREILGHLMLVAGKVSKILKLDNTFNIVINNGANAGQTVFHLHLHLLSGKSLNWLPA